MLKMIVAAQNLVASVMSDRKGVSSLEYGVMAAVVIAAVLAGGALLSNAITDAYTSLSTKITNAF